MLQYELAKFVANRIRMFEDKSTFWGRNRSSLFMIVSDDRRGVKRRNGMHYGIERKKKYPDSSFHCIPEDPWVYIPSTDHEVLLLKRKYLNRLRQDFMKLARRGKYS